MRRRALRVSRPASQIVGHHLDGQPVGVGGEAARGEMVESHAVVARIGLIKPFPTSVGRTKLRNTAVKVNGRLPFKVCHPVSPGNPNDHLNMCRLRF